MNETIRTISTATPTPRVETDASGATLNEYVYFGGKRVAVLPAGGNAQFYVEDLLGSSRVITTNNGTVCYD
ncbi:MAG TPA: hypothetical protein VJN93_13260, partial [Candidatus Acidoferrum sp.]|nr:hypothetical protein [Candidatus Acidoferrum sp.]